MSPLVLVGITGIVAVLILVAYKVPIFFICLECYSLVISQSFPIFYIGERPVNISPDNILIPVLIGAWLISVIKKRKIQPLPFFTIPYSLFSGWALFTIALSVFQYGISEHFVSFIETGKWFIYTLILLPCTEFIRTEKQARAVLKHIIIAAIIVVIIGYIQWALLPSRAHGNIVSTFGSIARQEIISVKNSFAVYVAMGLLVITAFFINRCINIWKGVFLFSAFIVLVFWSLSRSAVVSAICGMLWLYVTKYRMQIQTIYISKRTAWLLAGIFIFSLLSLGNYAISSPDDLEHTPIGSFASLWGDPAESHGARNVEVRREMLNVGIPALLENPIWGYGFFSRRITRSDLETVDNFYLDVALDTGLVGLFLMGWLLVSVLVFIFRIQRFALRYNAVDLHAWTCGIGAALICLYISGVSASIPYVGRILGTVVIILSCIVVWTKSIKNSLYDYHL